MKKTRILRVCHKFLVDDDGYDLDVQDLVTSLKGYETYVTVFLTEDSIAGYIKKNRLIKNHGYLYHKETGAYIIPITYTKKYGVYINDLYLRRNVNAFQKEFDKISSSLDPEIVHVHGTLTPQFLYAAKQSKRAGKKVFATHHIGLINQDHRRQKTSILFMKWIYHNSFPFFCDEIFCVSKHGRRSFLFKKNVAVVNPVPKITAPKNKKSVTIDAILKKNILVNGFEVKMDDQIFLCPARICEQKNQIRLVRAFSQTPKNFKLILAGTSDPHYVSRIVADIQKSGSAEKFCILDAVNPEQIHTLLQRSRCVAMPSLNEGLGRACMEAVIQGIPVLVSKMGGFVDYVQDGINGVLVNPLSERSIHEGLMHIPEQGPGKTKARHEGFITQIRNAYTTEALHLH